jgi:hypothetical protein
MEEEDAEKVATDGDGPGAEGGIEIIIPFWEVRA